MHQIEEEKEKHHDSKENDEKIDSDRNNDIVKVVVSSKDLAACYVNIVEESGNSTSQRKHKVFYKQPFFLKHHFSK